VAAAPASSFPSAGEIREIARTARSQAQFTQLASFYQARQSLYLGKAAEEKQLWQDRSQIAAPVMEKWPRPVDSARNLYQYDLEQAAQSAALAAKYSRLGDTPAGQ
jgi:hypothetical protein